MYIENRRFLDDLEVREFLEIYDWFVVDFGVGFLEDFVFFFVYVYEIVKFKNLVRMKEKMFFFIM